MGVFNFKQFSVDDTHCGMKIGTDAVLLGAWTDVGGAKCIVDAGCGSGVISLMMAQRNDTAEIIGVDIEQAACEDSTDNFKRSHWSARLSAMQLDITREFPAVAHPLLIVSNPPFFNEKLRSPVEERALARHGDDFGVETLISIAGRELTGTGDSLSFIAPTSRTDEIEFLLSLARLSPVHVTRVYSKEGKSSIRTLWQAKRDEDGTTRCVTDTLYIRDRNNDFSEEYVRLTSPFYLDK